MAAFYRYICRFENCLQKFNTLVDLIDHIEYMHIIRDPLIKTAGAFTATSHCFELCELFLFRESQKRET